MSRPRAVAVVALVAGLGALAAWQMRSHPVRGVSLEVRGVGSVNANPDAGEGASQSAGPNTVQIRGGRVVVNGRDGGPLRPGDSVLVDEQGRLFVNGQARETK
jgi:hypothetical protein